MKTFIKTVISICAVLSLAVAASAYAGSTNESSSWATVLVTDKGLSSTTWSPSTTVSPGEALHVQLHYYLNPGDSAQDMRFAVENLAGKTFEAGQTETVTGSVKADNLSTSNGSASVTFTDKVRLDLYNVSWQKGPCTSVGCESSLVESAGKVLTSNGMTIGDVEGYTGSNYQGKHYNGNVIVTFKVSEINDPTPTYDNCSLDGVTVQHGQSHRFYSREDVNSNQTCSMFDLVRTCNDGVLSGSSSFRYNSCTVDEPTNNNDDVEISTLSASSVDEDSARLNGRIDEGDNQEVWFAFDENDSTPSCSQSSQRVNVSGTYDDGDNFSKTVTNLDENEKYYFRACTLDEDGDVLSGNIREFVTDEEDDNNNNRDDAGVDTQSPSSIDEDSARLNGRVTEGDNVEVWFAFSRTDSTPSCTLSSQRINVSGSYDDGDNFSKTVTNLSQNTKYYYRACALGDNGDTETGTIREFVTDEDDNDDNPTSGNESVAITRIPSGVTTNSATLRSFVAGEGLASCYFQYGRTTSYGITTPAQTVDLDDIGECTSTRFNLSANTTYYYRAVLVDGGQTYFGLRQSFRTGSNPVVVNPRPPVVVNRPTTIIVDVVEQVEQEDINEIELTKFVSSVDDARFSDYTEADRDEAVFYKVVIENNGDRVLEDITVIDYIPFELELDGEEALDDDSAKEVRWRIARLQPGDTREFTTEMRVRDDVRYGSRIESFATAFNDDFSVNSNEVDIQVEEDQIADEVSQAASIFGADFFPTTLFGWLILLAIVLAIAYLVSRILFSRNENERVLAELRAMQDNQ